MSEDKFLYNGVDLRTASVFDLTDDADFLLRYLAPELGVNTKDDYLKLGESTPASRAFDMLEFAEEKEIKPLIEKLQLIYKDELAALFNE